MTGDTRERRWPTRGEWITSGRYLYSIWIATWIVYLWMLCTNEVLVISMGWVWLVDAGSWHVANKITSYHGQDVDGDLARLQICSSSSTCVNMWRNHGYLESEKSRDKWDLFLCLLMFDEEPQIYEDAELLQPREPFWKEQQCRALIFSRSSTSDWLWCQFENGRAYLGWALWATSKLICMFIHSLCTFVEFDGCD